MRSVGKETKSDIKKSIEISLVVNDERKCSKVERMDMLRKTVMRTI